MISEKGLALGTIQGTCPALEPLATKTLKLKAPSFMKAGETYRYIVETGSDTMNALTYETKHPKQKK